MGLGLKPDLSGQVGLQADDGAHFHPRRTLQLESRDGFFTRVSLPKYKEGR